ncbi:MAG: hypothetical protein WCO54_07320 [Bacteroidota bacterium]
MKAQTVLIIALCIAFASCKKNASDVVPPQPTPQTQALDTNINLIGTWRIDSVTYYTMNLADWDNKPFSYPRSVNSVDSIKFYSSINQNTNFTNAKNTKNWYYKIDSQSINFVKQSSYTNLPLPGWYGNFSIPFNWKQISNKNGMLNDFKYSPYQLYNASYIDKDSLGFNIYQLSNNSIILKIEPFVEFTDFRDCAGYDEWSLNGYYIKFYLTKIK